MQPRPKGLNKPSNVNQNEYVIKRKNIFSLDVICLQSIWGSDFTPSEGMSPLQQLLQEQKKQQKEDT